MNQPSVADRGSCRRDRGQAAVEVALVLPIVVVLALGLLQITVIARDHLAVTLAAREGARAASVAADAGAAASEAAHHSVRIRPLDVATHVSGSVVRVEVRHRTPTVVPIVSALIGDVEVSATATMALEPP